MTVILEVGGGYLAVFDERLPPSALVMGGLALTGGIPHTWTAAGVGLRAMRGYGNDATLLIAYIELDLDLAQ